MALLLAFLGCRQPAREPPQTDLTPPPSSATATCKACPAPPCTRACLPALEAGGPAPLALYAGGPCPTLVPGANVAFGHGRRDFLLFVPASTHGPFAVVFLWHGANGSASSFAPVLTGQYDAAGYILVVPDGQQRYLVDWDMDVRGADDDLRFFDDVLACLDQQFPIDRRRVHSAGYSAGGTFSAYLAGYRSDVLASFVSWSGGDRGLDGRIIVPVPPHAIPGLLYHGGDNDLPDWVGKTGTLSLASRMAANGQFTIVCDHGRGHVVPTDRMDDMWSFLLAHPFSPGNTAAWAATGIAGKLPSWCQVQ